MEKRSRLVLKILITSLMAVFAALALATTALASTTSYHVFAVDSQNLAYTFVSVTNIGTADVSVKFQAYDTEGILTGGEVTGIIPVGTQWNITTGSSGGSYSGAPQDFMGYGLITTSADTVGLFGLAVIVDANGTIIVPLTFTQKP